MRQLIKKVGARTVQVSYSLSESASTMATVGVSMAARFGGSAYGIIASVIAGLVQFVTTFSFSGKAAYKNTMGKEEEEEKEALSPKKASAAYYFTAYGYVTFYLVLKWLNLYFLVGNLKAYFFQKHMEDSNAHNHTVYDNLTALETSILTLYYLIVDMPFVITGPMWETVEQYQKEFSVQDDAVAKFFSKMFKPLITRPQIQSYVRIAGSLSHTVEHIAPMVIIALPVDWLHSMSDRQKALAITLTSVVSTLLSVPVFAETYLWDGRESVKNMRSLQPSSSNDLDYPNLSKTILTLLKYSIKIVGPLAHGAGAAMPLIQGGKFFRLSSGIVYGSGTAALLVSGFGNYKSEAEESSKEIDELIDRKIGYVTIQ